VSLEATLEEMIASIISNKGTITFSNEDLPLGGSVHNNALYLTIMCLQKYEPLAMILSGLALYVSPGEWLKI